MARRKTAEYIYTGKPCKKGHIGPRYKNGNCVECLLNREKEKLSDPDFAKQKREREKSRYMANPEKAREQCRKTREKYGTEWNAEKRLRYKNDPTYRESVISSVKAYRADNPDSVKKTQAAYYARNKIACNTRSAKYRQIQGEVLRIKNRELSKNHYQLNKERYWIKKQERRAICRQATPKWADKDAMIQLTKNAKEASVLFGEPFSVDHIVPLKGINREGIHIVSGLNWEGNMRIIPLAENKSKGNRFWENMP